MRTVYLMMVALAMALSSCRTTKTTETERVVTDTFMLTRVDTIRDVRYVSQKEKVYVSDTVIIVKDDSGKVKSQERTRLKIIEIENKDSINFYKSEIDSLRNIAKKLEKKQNNIIKKVYHYEGWGWFIALALAVVCWILRKKIM